MHALISHVLDIFLIFDCGKSCQPLLIKINHKGIIGSDCYIDAHVKLEAYKKGNRHISNSKPIIQVTDISNFKPIKKITNILNLKPIKGNRDMEGDCYIDAYIKLEAY